jgi:sialate O-acetylesterase
LKLATIFSNGMILQQRRVTKLFGFAAPDARVTVVLERFPADRHKPTDAETQYGVLHREEENADRDGYFEFRLPALIASYDPCRLTVRSVTDEIVINDILVGELWYAAGQDNMAQTVDQSDVDVCLADCVNLSAVRFFYMHEDGLSEQVPEYSYTPLGEAQGGHWRRGDQTYLMGDIPAIAFAFARDAHYAWDVPVGVIAAACPGTGIHAWLPREIIEGDPLMRNHAREIKLYRDQASWNLEVLERERTDASEPHTPRVFPRPQTVALLDGRKPDRPQPAPIIVQRAAIRTSPMAESVDPLAHAFHPRNQPTAMFNHKVAPFVGVSLRGVLWMQGESDVDSPEYYLRAFRYLAETLNGVFSFVDGEPVIVAAQLPPYLYNGVSAFGLAAFNEMLARARHTIQGRMGLVTVYDLPLDYKEQTNARGALTPLAKRAIGERMAKIATGLAWGGHVSASAPEPVSMERIGNKWMIDLTPEAVQGHGLQIGGGDSTLKGFAVCDEHRVFVKAEARILYGVRVLVWHDEMADPVSLTYAFANFNQDANLIGCDGLPVLPFRIDLEPSTYLKPAPWTDCDRLKAFAWKERLDDSVPRAKRRDWPKEQPLWYVTSGRAELALTDTLRKHGKADIVMTYRSADERPVEVDAAVAMASSYPPLNLTPYDAIELRVQNPDHQEKQIQLLLEDENGVVFESPPRTIEDAFREQSIVWGKGELANDTSSITRFAFRVTDPGERGSLILTRVVFSYAPSESMP